MKRILYAFILAAALVSLAQAQPGPMPGVGPEPGMMPDGDGRGPCEQACPPWEKERKMLEAVRITRMTEALELSDRQIAEFFPKLKQMDDGLRDLGKTKARLVTELDSILTKGVKEAELKAKLAQIENLEAERFNRMKTFKTEADRILTIKQQARLMVFNQNFDEEIRQMVRDIRQKRMKHFRD
jgi:hypothetical protein